MVKIYTKSGDGGNTGLVGGDRIKKSNVRIVAYGSIDELNSSIGIVLSHDHDPDINQILTAIQNHLFIVGSDLANPKLDDTSNRVTDQMIKFLETNIDLLEGELLPITYFILPGGSTLAAQLHLSRAICRRAESNVVRLSESENINKKIQIYLNRLSDMLFVIARTINKRKKIKDIPWEK